MNAEVVSETAVRTKRTRNIVTGFVIWIGAVVAVVFVVLNPTQSVEMRPGVDNSVQPAVTVASEHSTGSDEADDAKPEVSSIVFKGSTVAAPEPVATVESAQTADVPSESETETIPDSVAVTETNVQSETEVETATVADGENRTEAEGTSGTQATEVVQSSEPAEPVQSTEVVQSSEPAEPVQSTEVAQPAELALFVQVAAFSKVDNAQRKRNEISKALFPARVLTDRNGLNLVLVGPYLTESEAKKAQSDLNSTLQIAESFLKFVEVEPARVVTSEPTSDAIAQKSADAAASSDEKPAMSDGWYVRVGSYKNLGNAKTSSLRVQKLQLPTAITKEHDFNVLMAGPFQDKQTAENAKDTVSKALDVKDAYLVRVGS